MRNSVPFRKPYRVFAMILAVICLFTADGLAGTLSLPSALTVIDTEAFYGDTSLDEVTLPGGVTEIRSKAFAGSSVRKINLPDSLTFIAEDAFSDTSIEELTVGTDDTYAFQWAYNHDYVPPIIVTQPTSVFSGLNETAVFSLVARGDGAVYDWQYSEDLEEWTSVGVNSPSYAFTVTKENKDLCYRCVVSHGTKSSVSDTVRVENALPMNLSLSGTGILTFNITETKPHTVMLGVYGTQPASSPSFSLIPRAFADGNGLLAVIPVIIGANETSYTINISNFFTTTGEYRVEAKAVGSADEEGARDMGVGRIASSNTVYFRRPETALETPTGVSWGTGMAYGRASWNEVADAASYQVMLYSGNDIVASRNINTTYFDFSSGWVDFENVSAGQYSFTVTALSADITRVSNSDESAHSALLAEPDQTNAVSIVTQPASRYVAQNSAASVSVAVNGIGVTYQWFVDDVAVGQEDDYSINLDTSALGAQAVYCVVTDAFGNTERSATATVTVLDDSPVEHIISTQPNSVEVDPDGHAVYFTVDQNLPSFYRVDYTWYYSDDEGTSWTAFGPNRKQVSCNAYPQRSDMWFQCAVKATSPTGAVICEEMSSIAVLRVRRKDIAITTNLDSEYWTAGERYAFIGAQADESLNAQLTYQWYVDDQPWPGATMSLFDLSVITMDSQIYCELTAGQAVEYSRTAVVHVGPNPATGVEIIVQSGNTDHLAVGDSVLLRASLSPVKCTSEVVWSSVEPDVATVDQYGHVIAVGFGDAIITASAGDCSAGMTVHVDSYKVTYDPMGGRFPDGLTSNWAERVIIGQNATLPQVFLQGDTFLGWELNSTIVTSLIPASDVTLYAAWEKSVQQEDEDVEIAQDMEPLQYAKIGEYARFEVVTNGAKVRSYEWQISTNDGASWSRYDDGVVDGRKTSLEVLAAAENNGWQFRVVVTGYRNGTVVTSNVCTLTTGTTDTPPQTESFSFTLQPVDAACDEGGTVSFTVSVNADDAVYQWQKDGQNIPDATGAVYTLSGADLDDAGSYACVVTAGGSTKTSDSATLTVNQTLIHITLQPVDKEITEGADETLSIEATPVGVTYAWEEAIGDGWEPLGVGSELSLSGLSAGTHTIRSVVAKTGFASVISDEVTVDVNMAFYTVTYDANQGHFESGSTITVPNVRGTYTIDVPNPAREGFEFTGWMIGDDPVEGDTITVNGDVTLLASWREIRYAVTYDAAPGFFENDQRTLIVENIKGTYTLIDTVPARESYSFGGWKLDGQIVEGSIDVTEDITLTAEWLENPKPVITSDLASEYYPAEDGQGFMVQATGVDLHYQWQTKMPNEDWTDVPDNDSNIYAPFLNAEHDGMQVKCIISDLGYVPATSQESSVATFRWIKHATSITIEKVSGPDDLVVGDALTLRAVVEPEDCTDTITWTSGNESIATVNNGMVTITGLGDTAISASANGKSDSYNLTVNHIIVTLNANGGEFDDQSHEKMIRFAIGNYAAMPDFDAPGREGYSIQGWNTDQTDTALTTINIQSDVTLFAVWAKDPVYAESVQIQQDGSAPDMAQLIPDDVVQFAVATLPEETDDVFTWFSSSDDVATVNGQGVVTIHGIGTATITAQGHDASGTYTLTVSHLKVTLNANGGHFGDGAETHTEIVQTGAAGTAVYMLPAVNPTREGYSFGTWMQGDSAVTESIVISDNTVLTASWNGLAPEITQDLDLDYYPSEGGRGFMVTATGVDLHYQWQSRMPDGEWTNVGTDSNIYQPFLNASHDGMQVRCVVTDEGYDPATTTISATATFHWIIHATSVRIEEVDVPDDPIIGDLLALRAVVEPEGCTDTIIWTSDNTDIAAVNDGIVTINGLGNTVIRAFANDASTSYNLTVNHVTVTLNANGGKFSDDLETISKRVMTGAYVPSEEPENGVNRLAGWSYSADGETEETIVISGDTTLYAVWEIHAVSLMIQAPDDLSELAVEDMVELTAVCTPNDAVDEIIWTSDAPEIATVENGIVSILSNGTVTITAAAGQETDSITLTVNMVYVTLDANGGAFVDPDAGEPVSQKRVKTTMGAFTPAEEPVFEGFIFLGWSDTANGEIITDLNMTRPATLYAIWEEEDPAGELTILTQPSHVLAETGESVTFAVEAGLQNDNAFWVPEGISYQWQVYSQRNWNTEGTWADIPGATGDSYTVSSVTYSYYRAKYRVIVTYETDVATSDEAILFVLVGRDYPETMTVQVGEVVDLRIDVYGSPYASVVVCEENPDDQSLVIHGSDYIFRAAAEQDGHRFFCRVTLGDVIMQTQTMNLSVQQPMLIPYCVTIETWQDTIYIPSDPQMSEPFDIQSWVYKNEYDQYEGDEYDNLYYVWERSTDGSNWMITDIYGFESDDYHPATYQTWIDPASTDEGTYYYHLVVNGVPSESVMITFVTSEIVDDTCPECGGVGGEHSPGCPRGEGWEGWEG